MKGAMKGGDEDVPDPPCKSLVISCRWFGVWDANDELGLTTND
jgi:hypothetical protein